MKINPLLCLVVSFFYLTSSQSIAQESYFGIQSGVTITNVKADASLFNLESQIGVFCEVNYEHLIKNKHSFELGLLYNQKGYMNRLRFTDENGMPITSGNNSYQDYNYLGLPIKYGFRMNGKFSFTGSIGLVPAILLSATLRLPIFHNPSGGQFVPNGEYSKRENSDSFSSFELSSIIELEAAFKISPRMNLVGIGSFQYGLTNIYGGNNSPDNKVINYGALFGLGLKYKLAG